MSTSLGDDSNTGETEQKPVKTIKRALELGDTIYLKSGDVFFEAINIKNVYLASYGKGSLPKLCGWKRPTSLVWKPVANNIWMTSLTSSNFTGFTQDEPYVNNIGCIHEYDKDIIHGRKVQLRKSLKENWDLWQSEHHKRDELESHDFDNLYLYYEGDPNSIGLEFSVGKAGVIMENSTIEKIRIEGFGFGISARTRSIIRNCEIDAVGGMTMLNSNEFVSFGNGIEFYVYANIENCIVENCYISRCYDAGLSIQGSNHIGATPRNIIIRNNVVEKCCQGWEDFLRNGDHVFFDNCVFSDNLIINSGNTSGFSYPSRFKFCHILGNNTKGDKGMIILNNTFVGGNFYCSGAYNGEYKSNKWQGNTCVINRGDFLLGNYMGKKDVIRVPVEKGGFPTLKDATKDAISRYRELTGDETTRFVIKDSVAIDKQIKKLKKKYLRK